MACLLLYVVQTKVIDARNIQIANQDDGILPPSFAEVWVHPRYKCYTLADPRGGSSPSWNQTLHVLLPPGTAVEDAVLHVYVLHAGPELLVGSAELCLHDVLKDDGGGGGHPIRRTLQLNPQGTVDVELAVHEMRGVPPTTNVVSLPPPPPLRSGQEEDIGAMFPGFNLIAATVTTGLSTSLVLADGLDHLMIQIAQLEEIFEEFLSSDDDSESTEDSHDLFSDESSESTEDSHDLFSDEFSGTSEEVSETYSEDEDGNGDAVEIDLAYEDDGKEGNDDDDY